MSCQKTVNKKHFQNQIADGGILMNAGWHNNNLVSLSLDGPQSDKQVMLINHDKSKKNMSYTVQFAQNEQTIRIRNTTNYIYYDIMMMNIID